MAEHDDTTFDPVPHDDNEPPTDDPTPTLDEQRAVLLEHFDLALAANTGMRHPELHTGKTMRKFAIQFSKHHPEPDTVKRAFVRVKGLDEWRTVLDEHYTSSIAAHSS